MSLIRVVLDTHRVLAEAGSDLRSLAEWNPEVDIDAIAELLLELRGQTMHPRIARFRRMVREAQGG